MAERREEWLQERYADLTETLRSDGWRRVIRPALLERRLNIAQRLAAGRQMAEPAIRELQAQHHLLQLLTDDPADFFKTTYEAAADREFTDAA